MDNFVHADLHPGNILVQGADGLSESQEARLQPVDVCDALVVSMTPARCPLRLVLLDAGIVAELQAADLRNFRAVFMAVAMGQVRPTGPSGVGPKSFRLLRTSGLLSLRHSGKCPRLPKVLLTETSWVCSQNGLVPVPEASSKQLTVWDRKKRLLPKCHCVVCVVLSCPPSAST